MYPLARRHMERAWWASIPHQDFAETDLINLSPLDMQLSMTAHFLESFEEKSRDSSRQDKSTSDETCYDAAFFERLINTWP